jgi:hypothetical protein
VSDDYTLTTGTLSNAPKITKSGSGTSSMSGGFIVTTTGNGWGTGGGGGGTPMAVIFDIDGDVVWAASAPKGTSRARMSWDGKDMWVNNANVGNPNPSTAGEMRCISMDGLNVQNKVNGLSGAHHDFTVTPKNEVVTIAYTSSGTSSQILVRAANGTISTLMADVSTLYKPVGDCHPNYIQYYPSEDCFIISDRNPNLFVKFKRDGTLVWQFGGSNPKGKSFSVSETWQVNHGFEFEADGRFVFFNNGAGMGGGSSKIQEFKLNESTMSATKSWEKNTNGSSMSLGNVQRLPNGSSPSPTPARWKSSTARETSSGHSPPENSVTPSSARVCTGLPSITDCGGKDLGPRYAGFPQHMLSPKRTGSWPGRICRTLRHGLLFELRRSSTGTNGGRVGLLPQLSVSEFRNCSRKVGLS